MKLYDMMPKNNSNPQDSAAFYAVLTLLVEQREQYPHNLEFEWSCKDIAYISAGLQFLNGHQMLEFFERFRDYQIVKAFRERRAVFQHGQPSNFVL